MIVELDKVREWGTQHLERVLQGLVDVGFGVAQHIEPRKYPKFSIYGGDKEVGDISTGYYSHTLRILNTPEYLDKFYDALRKTQEILFVSPSPNSC